MSLRNLYESYHRGRKLQRRVIDENNFTYRHVISAINKCGKAKNVLDISSGVGTMDFYLASKGKNVMGVEIAKEAIGAANKTAKFLDLEKKTTFIRDDFFKQKMLRKFDLILCSEVLEHLEDERMALKKIYKYLKKRGGGIDYSPLN